MANKPRQGQSKAGGQGQRNKKSKGSEFRKNDRSRAGGRPSKARGQGRRPTGDNKFRKDNRPEQDQPVNNEEMLGYQPMNIFHKKNPDIDIPCPYFKKCGGCQLLDVTYDESLKLKQKAIERLLYKFGKVNKIIGMDDPFSYRNKSVATYDRLAKEQYIWGMYKSNSHNIVAIDRCLIQDKRADAIAETIRSLMKSFKMTSYDERNGRGFLRHVLIRIGQKTDEIMVVMVATTPIFAGKNNFIKVMKEKHPEITTMILNINDKDTTMVLGDRDIKLYGKGFIQDELCGLTFRISPHSFYQINPLQTEILYDKAMEMAGLSGEETVLDAYSGIGTISLIAAKKSKMVYGVELNKDAVRDAIGNAKGNKITNAKFFAADAGEFMVGMAAEGESLDVVFMDPPRSGSTQAFIKSIGKLKPKKVVYVSCGPESLARDLKWLEQEGYKVQEMQPVDMFPWTNHVECVLSMIKKSL